MAIFATPVYSEPRNLADVSKDVSRLEGDIPELEKVWVRVRQATESDNMEIAAMTSKSRTIFTQGGTESLQEVNPRDVRAMEVFRTLTDAGNFWSDPEGKIPLFEFETVGKHTRIKGGFQAFRSKYGELPVEVTAAILDVVYEFNPGWDWTRSRFVKCPECQHVHDMYDFEVDEPVGEAE